MKKYTLLKVISSLSILATMANAQAYEGLDILNKRAQNLQKMGLDQAVQANIAKVEKQITDLLKGVGPVIQIINLERAQKKSADRNRFLKTADHRPAARSLDNILNGADKQQARTVALFAKEKLTKSIMKYKTESLETLQAIQITATTKSATTKVDSENIELLKKYNTTYNSYYGLDADGNKTDGTNFSECLGMDDIDMAIYHKASEEVMSDYAEAVKKNASYPINLDKGLFNMDNSDITISYDPVKMYNITEEKSKKFIYSTNGAIGDLDSLQKYIVKGKLTLNKQTLKILNDYDIISSDQVTAEKNLVTSKSTTDNILTLTAKIQKYAKDLEVSKASESVASNYMKRLRDLEKKYTTDFSCYINPESIKAGKFVDSINDNTKSAQPIKTTPGKANEATPSIISV